MRRLFAILLIVASGWLLYQATDRFAGVPMSALLDRMMVHAEDPRFVTQLAGGILGLLGGLTCFFAGPGGALLALLGGALVAGFTLFIEHSFGEVSLRVWESGTAVGLVMLFLAGMVAVLPRS